MDCKATHTLGRRISSAGSPTQRPLESHYRLVSPRVPFRLLTSGKSIYWKICTEASSFGPPFTPLPSSQASRNSNAHINDPFAYPVNHNPLVPTSVQRSKAQELNDALPVIRECGRFDGGAFPDSPLGNSRPAAIIRTRDAGIWSPMRTPSRLIVNVSIAEPTRCAAVAACD